MLQQPALADLIARYETALWEAGVIDTLRDAVLAGVRAAGPSVEAFLAPVVRAESAPPATLAPPPRPGRVWAGFDVDRPEARRWAETWAAATLRDLAEETRRAIRDQIVWALREGIAPVTLAHRLVELGLVQLGGRQAIALQKLHAKLTAAGWSLERADDHVRKRTLALARRRAKLLARDEIGRALAFGQRAAWQAAVQQGLLQSADVEREWLITPDERLCPRCRPQAGLRAKLIGEYQLKGPDSGRAIPGPPLHRLCRCSERLVATSAVSGPGVLPGGPVPPVPAAPSPAASPATVDATIARALERRAAIVERLARTRDPQEAIDILWTDVLGEAPDRLPRVGRLSRSAELRGFAGLFELDKWTIKLSPRIIDRIASGYLAEMQNPAARDALATLLHELVHATTAIPGREYTMGWWGRFGRQPIPIGTALEEGFAEWYAQRLVLALAEGRATGRPLAEIAYARYVEPLLQIEERLGSARVRAIFYRRTTADRVSAFETALRDALAVQLQTKVPSQLWTEPGVLAAVAFSEPIKIWSATSLADIVALLAPYQGGRFAPALGALHVARTDPKKVRLAVATYKPSTAAKQRLAEAQQTIIARALRGAVTDDNAPLDVVATVGGRRVGIEVKTFIDNANDKVTMHPDSLRRKLRWATETRTPLVTVVVDRRDVGLPRFYSGHRWYVRCGVGSFRLASLTPLRSLQALRAAIATCVRGGGHA